MIQLRVSPERRGCSFLLCRKSHTIYESTLICHEKDLTNEGGGGGENKAAEALQIKIAENLQ